MPPFIGWVYLGVAIFFTKAILVYNSVDEKESKNEDPAVFLNFLRRKPLEYKYIELSPYQLLIGYDINCEPLIADMKKTPHVLIAGLSGQGKSWCMKQMIKNLSGANYVIVNGFVEDFEDTIIGKNIYEYFKALVGNLVVQEKPLYIFIDELMTLEKPALDLIEKILCVGRHYNIFVVGSIQRPSKKSLDIKDLFNVGVSFKQRDDSNYRLLFNSGIDVTLRPREFAMLSDDMYYGETYII